MRLLLGLLIALGTLPSARAAWVQLNGSTVTQYDIGGEPSPSTGWTQVPDTDARLAAKIAADQSAATAAANFAATLAQGLTITSTSNPALSATFPLDSDSRSNLIALQTGINAAAGLPNNAATVAIFDTAGAVHNLTAAQLTKLATMARDCYATLIGLRTQALAGIAVTWTPCAVTIP